MKAHYSRVGIAGMLLMFKHDIAREETNEPVPYTHGSTFTIYMHTNTYIPYLLTCNMHIMPHDYFLFVPTLAIYFFFLRVLTDDSFA